MVWQSIVQQQGKSSQKRKLVVIMVLSNLMITNLKAYVLQKPKRSYLNQIKEASSDDARSPFDMHEPCLKSLLLDTDYQ